MKSKRILVSLALSLAVIPNAPTKANLSDAWQTSGSYYHIPALLTGFGAYMLSTYAVKNTMIIEFEIC